MPNTGRAEHVAEAGCGRRSDQPRQFANPDIMKRFVARTVSTVPLGRRARHRRAASAALTRDGADHHHPGQRLST